MDPFSLYTIEGWKVRDRPRELVGGQVKEGPFEGFRGIRGDRTNEIKETEDSGHGNWSAEAIKF